MKKIKPLLLLFAFVFMKIISYAMFIVTGMIVVKQLPNPEPITFLFNVFCAFAVDFGSSLVGEEWKKYIKILEETMEKYKNIPIQRRLSKNDISTSVVRLSDREVFTKDNTDQRFYYIDKESLTKKYYTFEEIQKFIDHGLFAVLKHSNDPMWQKPLSTSNPIPNTTSP